MLKRFLWFVILAFFFALGRNYLTDHARLQDLRDKNSALKTKISSLQQEITRLKDEEDRLTHDPEYVERRARSKLKMSKEGEVIFKQAP
ncbi:MAG: septum formation initiator family protein [Candidatus Omnitrophica bacterium]|nr:septum formation initiator family protein [Candidatus Omnitrophota bacterium]